MIWILLSVVAMGFQDKGAGPWWLFAKPVTCTQKGFSVVSNSLSEGAAPTYCWAICDHFFL